MENTEKFQHFNKKKITYTYRYAHTYTHKQGGFIGSYWILWDR